MANVVQINRKISLISLISCCLVRKIGFHSNLEVQLREEKLLHRQASPHGLSVCKVTFGNRNNNIRNSLSISIDLKGFDLRIGVSDILAGLSPRLRLIETHRVHVLPGILSQPCGLQSARDMIEGFPDLFLQAVWVVPSSLIPTCPPTMMVRALAGTMTAWEIPNISQAFSPPAKLWNSKPWAKSLEG